MSGRDIARIFFGLGGRGQPKAWNYPESSAELERLTGDQWRPLNTRPMVVLNYFPQGFWDPPVLPEEEPRWDRAWATRYNGWLIIYSIVDEPGPLWPAAATVEFIAPIEADRPALERISDFLFDRVAEVVIVHETDDPSLPYLLWLDLRDLVDSAADGVMFEALPPSTRPTEVLLWEFRTMKRVIDVITEELHEPPET